MFPLVHFIVSMSLSVVWAVLTSCFSTSAGDAPFVTYTQSTTWTNRNRKNFIANGQNDKNRECKWTRNAWISLIAVGWKSGHACDAHVHTVMHLHSEIQIDPLETCDAHIVTYTKQNTCSYFRMEFVCANFCCCWWCCGVCEKMRNFITSLAIRNGFCWKSWIRKRARSHAGVPSKINIL